MLQPLQVAEARSYRGKKYYFNTRLLTVISTFLFFPLKIEKWLEWLECPRSPCGSKGHALQGGEAILERLEQALGCETPGQSPEP